MCAAVSYIGGNGATSTAAMGGNGATSTAAIGGNGATSTAAIGGNAAPPTAAAPCRTTQYRRGTPKPVPAPYSTKATPATASASPGDCCGKGRYPTDQSSHPR